MGQNQFWENTGSMNSEMRRPDFTGRMSSINCSAFHLTWNVHTKTLSTVLAFTIKRIYFSVNKNLRKNKKPSDILASPCPNPMVIYMKSWYSHIPIFSSFSLPGTSGLVFALLFCFSICVRPCYGRNCCWNSPTSVLDKQFYRFKYYFFDIPIK